MHYLTQSTQKSTLENYNRHWKNWAAWCLPKNSKQHPLPLVVEHLAVLNSLSLQHLRVVRSTIISVYRVVHSQGLSLASGALVQQFFKARKRTRSYQTDIRGTFDIDPILNLVDNWGTTNELANCKRRH